ncbi:Hpt domain-containing protein [Ramlibacter sp. AN1133]|uniref:Hpt domain-containing protein n=1 Tax=Ramlibacter sp. AN1133 TaxID=3133429 RepID=UPI0030BA519D
MKHPTGASGNAAAPLAGRRILLVGDLASLATALRHGGAAVLQARADAALPEQLRAAAGVDAVLVELDAPDTDGLAAARAIRAGHAPWAAVPLLGLAADPDAFAEAAAAAGINGLLARPVETTLLYETLTRFITSGAALVQRTSSGAPVGGTSVVPEPLLNLQRLDSYQRLGMLDELVNDYLPEMSRLLAALREAAGRADVQGSLAALHSLLGMSGEAGAQGLYHHVRRLYVPLLEHAEWPPQADWLAQLAQLAARTEEALKAYCAQQARSSAA